MAALEVLNSEVMHLSYSGSVGMTSAFAKLMDSNMLQPPKSSQHREGRNPNACTLLLGLKCTWAAKSLVGVSLRVKCAASERFSVWTCACEAAAQPTDDFLDSSPSFASCP